MAAFEACPCALVSDQPRLLAGEALAPSKTTVPMNGPWGQGTHCSLAVRIGDTIHASGVTCQGETCHDQVKACFETIDKAIKGAGGRGLQDVVITRMIAADARGDLDELQSGHKAVFEPLGLHPANTTFGGTLLREWAKVEIEATAVIQTE